MEEKRKKRNVAIEKRISDLTEDDLRVKVLGEVIEKDSSNNSIKIKYKDEILTILLNENMFKNVEKGKIIRVIGIIAPPLEGDKVELKGEIIQNFTGLNLELYEKYLKLKSFE